MTSEVSQIKEPASNVESVSSSSSIQSLGIAPSCSIGNGLIQADLMAQKASKGDKVKNYRTAKYRVCKSGLKNNGSNTSERSKAELATQAKDNARLLIQSLGSEGGILSDVSQFLLDVEESLDISDNNMTFPKMRSMWTISEDRLLTLGVRLYGANTESWPKIAVLVPGRTNKACRKRWFHSLDPSLHKGSWSAEEDALLISWVQKLPGQWSKIAKKIQGRTDDQCAKRWRESLDPSISRIKWTKAEDEILIDKYNELGAQWQKIATFFDGRPGLHCRNRWRKIQRRSQQDKSCVNDANSSNSNSSLNMAEESKASQVLSDKTDGKSKKKRLRSSLIENQSLLMSPIIKKRVLDSERKSPRREKCSKASPQKIVSSSEDDFILPSNNSSHDVSDPDQCLFPQGFGDFPSIYLSHDVSSLNPPLSQEIDIFSSMNSLEDFHTPYINNDRISDIQPSVSSMQDVLHCGGGDFFSGLDPSFYNNNCFPGINSEFVRDLKFYDNKELDSYLHQCSDIPKKQKHGKKSGRGIVSVPPQDKRDYLVSSNIKLYGCAAMIGVCNEVYTTSDELESHLLLVHNYSNSNADDCQGFENGGIKWSHVYRCGMIGCSSLYKNIKGLEYHIFYSRKSGIHFTGFDNYKTRQKTSIHNLTNGFDFRPSDAHFVEDLKQGVQFKNSSKMGFDNSIEFLLSNNEIADSLNIFSNSNQTSRVSNDCSNFNSEVLNSFVNEDYQNSDNAFDVSIFARKAISNYDFPTQDLSNSGGYMLDKFLLDDENPKDQSVGCSHSVPIGQGDLRRFGGLFGDLTGSKVSHAFRNPIINRTPHPRKPNTRSMSLSGLDGANIFNSFKDQNLTSSQDSNDPDSLKKSLDFFQKDQLDRSLRNVPAKDVQFNPWSQFISSVDEGRGSQFFQMCSQALMNNKSQVDLNTKSAPIISELAVDFFQDRSNNNLNNRDCDPSAAGPLQSKSPLSKSTENYTVHNNTSSLDSKVSNASTSDSSSDSEDHITNTDQSAGCVNTFEQGIHDFLEYFESKIECGFGMESCTKDDGLIESQVEAPAC
ncbi:Transcriptional activator Myb [Smittium mucronatum]|uniref:Transcriptional activator Myb n=1 Tax=Smittium mucronatum TaxID=133383 RepID=A0A1R0GV20_9FUNG|nr:Transcriptional activator Myb [Smittium mucronatum]